jgi:hypothetical protein
VGAIAQSVATLHGPAELIIVKIDNWFGHKWLKFSGKVMGAFGMWKHELTVPPFVPNRVVWERHFELASSSERKDRAPLHASRPASEAELLKLSNVAPDAAIVWFSARSGTNDRGSIMCCIVSSKEQWAWYAGWSRSDSFNSAALKGISGTEFFVLLNPASV